jgi:hypothetical protein
MLKKHMSGKLGRGVSATLFTLTMYWAQSAIAEKCLSTIVADPLQPVASALTQCVMMTRGGFDVDDKAILRQMDTARKALAQVIVQAAGSAPVAYEDDLHFHEDLGRMLSFLETGRHYLEEGDKHGAHHALKDIRLLISEVRSRNGIVAIGDMVWRYNCAFHPMMHEIMHDPGEKTITGEQIAICRSAVENAELALNALEAVANHGCYKKAAQLASLIGECAHSLDRLDQALKKEETAQVIPLLKAVRASYIKLAAYEAENG